MYLKYPHILLYITTGGLIESPRPGQTLHLHTPSFLIGAWRNSCADVHIRPTSGTSHMPMEINIVAKISAYCHVQCGFVTVVGSVFGLAATDCNANRGLKILISAWMDQTFSPDRKESCIVSSLRLIHPYHL